MRFVQLFNGAYASGGKLNWDGHNALKEQYDVHAAILCVSAQTNHGRNIEIEFPKCFGQSVRRPKLLLTRDTRTGTEIADEIGLGQNDSRCSIYF